MFELTELTIPTKSKKQFPFYSLKRIEIKMLFPELFKLSVKNKTNNTRVNYEMTCPLIKETSNGCLVCHNFQDHFLFGWASLSSHLNFI